MLEINKKRLIFKIKEIWFADYPFDVEKCDSVVFRGCRNKIDVQGFKRIAFPTLVIDLSQDLGKIWKDMRKSSCRYAITRAEKEDVIVEKNRNYEEFFKIYLQFIKLKHLRRNKDLSVRFMKKYGVLFTAKNKNNEILGGQFYLEDPSLSSIRWLIGASRRLEVDKKNQSLIGNANRLITWYAIKYAKEKGIKEFDMGGYCTSKVNGGQREGINFFKKSFGGKLTTHYIYQKDYSKLYRTLSLLKQKLF